MPLCRIARCADVPREGARIIEQLASTCRVWGVHEPEGYSMTRLLDRPTEDMQLLHNEIEGAGNT